jgi:hypothetical protein
MKNADLQARKEPLSRKKYFTPRLTDYGNVTQVTRGGSGNMADGTMGSRQGACWIAEVLFGIDSPRTRLVRAWLRESYERRDPVARMVVPLYYRFGVAIADLLRRRPALQPLFRPLFDRAVKCAHREYAARAVLLQA